MGDTPTLTPTTTVVLPSYRYPTPPTFGGDRDGFACEAWLTTVRRFFVGAGIPDDRRTVTALAYIGASAIIWWDGLSLPDTTTWEDFESAFRGEFRPAGFFDNVRSLLFSIKMATTVADYVSRTRRYVAILSAEAHAEARSMLEGAAKTCFLQGAPLSLRQMLMGMEITSTTNFGIHEMCQAAERFDHIYHFSASLSSSSTATTPTAALQAAHAYAAAQPDPMAMEIDNLRMELNALRRQVHHQPGTLPRLTDADRARLMQRGACFRCREEGHMARECPKWKGKGRAVHNMNYNEGGHPGSSGKAPSDHV